MFLLAFALIKSSKYQILLDSLEAKAQRLGIDRQNYIANANNLIIKKVQKKLFEKVNFAICPEWNFKFKNDKITHKNQHIQHCNLLKNISLQHFFYQEEVFVSQTITIIVFALIVLMKCTG